MNQGYSAYRTANVETADKGKLIIICYDVAIKHGHHVLEMENPRANLEQYVKHVYKMQDAVNELISALNMDVGEIAVNLYRLYDYMIYRLTQAVVKVEPDYVREITEMMTDLRSAWKVAIQNVKVAKVETPVTAHTAKTFAFNG